MMAPGSVDHETSLNDRSPAACASVAGATTKRRLSPEAYWSSRMRPACSAERVPEGSSSVTVKGVM